MTRKRLLLIIGLGGLIFTAILFRHNIRSILTRQKTVASVVDQLRTKRGGEFLKSYPDLPAIKEILLVAIKKSRRLEVWTRSGDEEVFQYRKTYPFTGSSGVLGPKRKSGDRQIPEGIYEIVGLNPNSREHLSIKVGYPNTTDREFAKKENRSELGGDIFIHGNNTSIGCIPIGNRNIEELFFVVAAVGYAKTRIVIMPVDFRQRRHRSHRGKDAYQKQVYRRIRDEIRAKIPAHDLSATFLFPRVRKKA
jgi:L,D-transpeptidase catalytic domain